MELKGTYTAIVTPLNKDGSVDHGCLRDLIEWQAENHIDGIVPVGTTGESPTLSVDDHRRVIETTVDACRGRMSVIAGTGGNSTEEAVDLTRHAREIGADASLQVTPYYNKPSQEGLFRHFSAVAELDIPIILYNVPGRSACEIAVETIARLAVIPGVVAVKEAGGSVDRVSAIRQACSIDVLSGDDSLTLPMISVGAVGVVSVASNVAPAMVGQMVDLALKGDFNAARSMHERLYPLFKDLFLDTNPVPVKAALAMMKRIEEIYRLPLCEPSSEVRETLYRTLQTLRII